MDNVGKFNNMGITDNTINMLDHFNDKVEPKSEIDIQREKERESADKKDDEKRKKK